MYTFVTAFFLVLCSGLPQVSLAANRLRRFNFSEKTPKHWDDARNTCLGKGGSLLSLYDKEDAGMMQNFSSRSGVWLGLRRNGSYFPTWSNGEKFIFNESTADVKNGEQLCEAIENGTWKSCNCLEEKAFMCQHDNNYTLVELEHGENWCRALQYCRNHFTDLASISNEGQNEKLKNKSLGKSFWIGLQQDEWKQADKSCSTYREKIQPQTNKDCVVVFNNMKWREMNCNNDKGIICYTGSVKIKVIKESKTWEEALDYCKARHSRLLWIEDQEDQFAVEQWLNYTSTGSIERLWIGLRQSSIFGFWIWSDRIVSYSNWENGLQPVMPSSKHCGVINAYTFEWSDEDCGNKLPFLCEEDIIYM